MYILSLMGHEGEGAYSLEDETGTNNFTCFRMRMMQRDMQDFLEADDYHKLSVVEIDEELAIEACNRYNYKYVIVTPQDIVFPPYDSISED